MIKFEATFISKDYDDNDEFFMDFPFPEGRLEECETNVDDYIIGGTDPFIPGAEEIGILELNDKINRINRENPDMDAYYLGIILDATGSSLADDETVDRLCKKDFFIANITEDFDREKGGDMESAGSKYIAKTLRIPFKKGISPDELHALVKAGDEYVDWYGIFDKYEEMGFSVTEGYHRDIYLIHWKK